MLGALLGVLYWVPVLNLAVPVLSGLAFTHFGLAKLAALRAQPGGAGSRLRAEAALGNVDR
jgi:hypothetical protein